MAKGIIKHFFSVLTHAGGAVAAIWVTTTHMFGGNSEDRIRAQFAAYYGNTALSRQASQYLHTEVRWGYFLMLAGLVLSVVVYVGDKPLSSEEFSLRRRGTGGSRTSSANSAVRSAMVSCCSPSS